MFSLIFFASLALCAPLPQSSSSSSSIAGPGQTVINGVVVDGPGKGTVQGQVPTSQGQGSDPINSVNPNPNIFGGQALNNGNDGSVFGSGTQNSIPPIPEIPNIKSMFPDGFFNQAPPVSGNSQSVSSVAGPGQTVVNGVVVSGPGAGTVKHGI